MEDAVYKDFLDRASDLSHNDQRRLLEGLRSLVERDHTETETRSVLELQGLGKHVWAGVDAQEYVDRERASWPG